jgi:hypothetical protein
MFLTIASVLAPAVALAQPPVVSEPTSTAKFSGATTGSGRGFGVGVVALFDPSNHTVPNLLATWGDSGGRFHVDGIFGFDHTDTTTLDFGARGWYHVHAASSADLSAGLGLALVTWKNGLPGTATPPAGSRQWDFEMDIGAQMRVFVVPNVALLVGLGLGLYIPDTGSSTVRLSGNIMNSVGLAYYFL